MFVQCLVCMFHSAFPLLSGKSSLDAFYTEPPSGSGDKGDGSASGGGGGWLVPCSYSSITSPFGYRQSPATGASSYHQGVDLDSTTGTPVVASRAGVVTVAGWGSAAGNYVQIDHQDGFRTIYMHLNNYSVRTG